MSDASIGTASPLPRELEDFLRPERERPDADVGGAQAAVFARLQSTLGLAGSVPNAGAGSGAGDTAAAAGRAGVHLTARALARTVITLTVGAVLGAGGHAEWARRARQRDVAARVAAPAVAPSALPAAPPPTPSPPPAVVAPELEPPRAAAHHPEAGPARSPRIASPEARRRDVDLAAERTLIEQARSALARNQDEAALGALGRHLRAFPDGELREERESLMVQVLVGLERYDEARRAGARFRRRFPQSIFSPVVEEALRSIPSIP